MLARYHQGLDPRDEDDRTAYQALISNPLLCSQQIDAAIAFIKAGVSPNTTNAYGETLLHLATGMKNGKLPLVRDLLALGIDPMIKDSDGETAYDNLVNQLFYKNDDITTVKVLIAAGVTPTPNKKGKTPLHIAIQYGHLQHIPDLLNCGIDPKIKDNKNRNAYYYLIEKTRFSSAEIDAAITLIKAGVDPNTTNKDGETLLHLATLRSNNGRLLPLVLDLLALGINPMIKDNQGETAYDNLVNHRHNEDDDIATIMALISAGVTPTPNKMGKTPLHIAIQRSYPQHIPGLLKLGVDPTIKDNQGHDAYYYLMKYLMKKKLLSSHIEAAIAFIRAGVDLNTTNEDGKTLLHLVVAKEAGGDKHSLVRDLLALGINPAIKDKFEHTALQNLMSQTYYSCDDSKSELLTARMLMQASLAPSNTCNDRGQTLLHVAVSWDQTDSIPELLSQGINPRIKDNHGKTVYDYLVNGGRFYQEKKIIVVMTLISAGVTPTPNRQGKTLLHIAIDYSYFHHVPGLLNLGIDPKIKDDKGHDAYYYLMEEASRWDAGTAAIALIKAGVDPNTTNEDGKTWLHLILSDLTSDSFETKPYKSILTLIELGAKLDIKDKAGKFPFDYFKGKRIKLFFDMAKTKTMPGRICNLLQQNIIKPTTDELTDFLEIIKKSDQFDDFGMVIDLLLRGAKPP